MQLIRELIQSILADDAIYRRRDLPGDLDDPPESHHDEDHECDCGCNDCDGGEDYVTPKYALYSAIGDAIDVYDNMDDDEFGDESDDIIMKIAEDIRKIKR
jgi:hypothetical protein